ncbi:NACHT and WD repeat domain-containing protein 2-like [Antedon mediterranea]|uniref:NACHT and WD repeat domain-containing protein 2-like n=1 Tax=Antedon mediterranea TaxID=105859 RepID=UPI003AF60789
MGNAVGMQLPGKPAKSTEKKSWNRLSAYRTAHMATIRMRGGGLWDTPRDDRQPWKTILKDAADEFEDFLIGMQRVENDVEKRDEFREMMQGKIPDMHIKRNGNEVWVFVSSTFTDTKMERDLLMEDVYPFLREFCRKIGLDFNVVDLRWGIRRVLANSHQATSICLAEVQRCRKTSIGPFFVGILGNKYGWRPIPRIIESKTFMTFMSYMENSTSRDAADDNAIELLKEWYKLDTNSLEPEFVLQPITNKFPNYDKNSSDDIKGWNDTFDILQKAIFSAIMFSELSHDTKMELTRSITEGEIMEAIDDKSEQKRCFFFDRDLRSFDAQQASKIGYVDMVHGNVDANASRKLEQLKSTIWNNLQESNLNRYKMEFKPSNEEMSTNPENKKALKTFCDKFCEYMVDSIKNGAAEHRSTMNNSVYAEVVNHSVFARERAEMFSGRESILEEIMTYLKQESGKKPFVLHGVGGSGKTSVLAKVFSKSLARWDTMNSDERPAHIVRFIGVTPESSNIRDLLYSVCRQLSYVLKINPSSVQGDYKHLEEKFMQLLQKATSSMPFIIFIDSLDQLSDDNEGRDLHWLPCNLPPFVHMIVTVRPNAGGCLSASKNVVKSKEYFLEILPPDEADTNSMIDLLLAKENRTVSSQQKKVIIGAHKDGKPTPLFLKLACDIAKSWHSYTDESECTLADTVNGLINQLFNELEEIHGQTLVRRALGYITAAKTGLSANELLDVLSCDEIVLDDCFEFHIPPIRRLPSLLWTRLRLDLGSYIVEGGADDVVVYRWYHRLFHEVARQRYLSENDQFLHQSLAHYFMGRWANVPKPFRDKKTNEPNIANRRLPLQPLVVVSRKGKMNSDRFNLRKLTELPYHLIKAGMWTECEKELCTIPWIRAKCKTGRSYQLVLELAEASAKAENSPTLRDFYRLVRANIHMFQAHPELICQQALNEPDASVCTLAAMDYIRERNNTMNCLLDLSKNQTVNSEVMTLQHTAAVKLCKFSPSAKYLATVSGEDIFKVWRVASGALEMTLECSAMKVEFPSNCHWVCCLTRTGIYVYGLGTGGFPKGKLSMCIETDVDHLATMLIPKPCKIIHVVSYGRLITYRVPSGNVVKKRELKCRPKCVAFAPNEKWLVMANKTVVLWDISKQQEAKMFGANNLKTNLTGSFLAFSLDSKRVLGILPNGTYRWNTAGANPEPIGDRLSLNCQQGHAVISQNLDYVASMDGQDSTLRILKFQKSGATWTYLKGHTAPVSSCSFERSQDDTTMVATGSEDQSVRIWDSRDLSTENFARGVTHSHAIESCIFSPDGTSAVTVASNKTTYFWQTNVSPPTVTRVLVSETSCHVKRIGCVSENNMFVVGFCGDQAIDIWNTSASTTTANSMTINCKHKLVPFASPTFFFVHFSRSGLNAYFSTGNRPGVLYCMSVMASCMVDEWKSCPDIFPADVYESDLRDFKHGDNQKIVSAVMNKDGDRLATLSVIVSENQSAAMLADVDIQGTLSFTIWSPSYSRILKKCSLGNNFSRAHQLGFLGPNVLVFYQKISRNAKDNKECVVQVLEYDSMNIIYEQSLTANYNRIFVKPKTNVTISDEKLLDTLMLGYVEQDMLHLAELDSKKDANKYCYKSIDITSFDLSRDRRSVIAGFQNGSVRFLRFVNIK